MRTIQNLKLMVGGNSEMLEGEMSKLRQELLASEKKRSQIVEEKE